MTKPAPTAPTRRYERNAGIPGGSAPPHVVDAKAMAVEGCAWHGRSALASLAGRAHRPPVRRYAADFAGRRQRLSSFSAASYLKFDGWHLYHVAAALTAL